MNKIKVGVKKLHEDAILPKYAHDSDSGFDFYSVEELILQPKEKGIVRTGLAFDLPLGWGVAVRNKSGITTKGFPCIKLLCNGKIRDEIREDGTVYLGTIDSSYRGEVGIMVKNEEDHEMIIQKGVKLAQGVLEKVYQCDFTEVFELSSTERSDGGYGSTGIK